MKARTSLEEISQHEEIKEHFSPLGIVGQGAYGVVLSAIETKTHKTVALKVLKDFLQRTPCFRKWSRSFSKTK